MEHQDGETLEVLPNKNMSQSENAPVSYYGDNGMGSGASAALLAGLATKDNYNPVDMVSAGGICDLRAEVSNNRWFVKDAEAQIRRDIAKAESEIRAEVLKEGQENMAATKDAECNLSKEILETRHTLAKDILRSEYESKLAVQSAIKEINEKVDKESERTNDKVLESRHFNAEKFCTLENLIKEDRTKALEDKVFKLSQDLQTSRLIEKICCEGCGNTGPGNSAK